MSDENSNQDLNFSYAELRAMMSELNVNKNVDSNRLKKAYAREILIHHTDKGGDVLKAQNITRAYRVLRSYISFGITLPDRCLDPSLLNARWTHQWKFDVKMNQKMAKHRPRDCNDAKGHLPPRQWDFDVMMNKKKAEKRKYRLSHWDDKINLNTYVNQQIMILVKAMIEAANKDRNSNNHRQPAIQKIKMLPQVKSTLMRANLFESLIENGMMNAISQWLALLPDNSLPAWEIRSMLLRILLVDFSKLDHSTLKQSGLGKAVMILKMHPKETSKNKDLASQLIREWS